MPAVRKNRWIQLGWKLHRWLYRVSAGRIGGRLAGWSVLLLTATGRRSRPWRDSPVLDSADHGGASVAPAIASDGFTRPSQSSCCAIPRPADLPRGRPHPLARLGAPLRGPRRAEALLVHGLAPDGSKGHERWTAQGGSPASCPRRHPQRTAWLLERGAGGVVFGRSPRDLPPSGSRRASLTDDPYA
jgi:hypothetical protein